MNSTTKRAGYGSRLTLIFSLLVVAAVFTACQTVPPPPPANFAEAGWKVRQGQALWKGENAISEIAGELLVATHTNGQVYVSFSKTPVTLVSAQSTPNQWYINFPPNGQWHGFNPPPSRVIWLHLAKFLDGAPPPSRWSWERRDNNGWRLENRATGESLEGFLNP